MPVHHLDIVTLGWDLPGWLGKFYPEDLPPEWRLTYFANEFPAVLIPLRLWAGADVRQMRRWAGDVHQNFRFYLELPARADPAAFGSKIAALGNKLCGLVGIGEGGMRCPQPSSGGRRTPQVPRRDSLPPIGCQGWRWICAQTVPGLSRSPGARRARPV